MNFSQWPLRYGYHLQCILRNPLKGMLHLNSPPNGSEQLRFTLTPRDRELVAVARGESDRMTTYSKKLSGLKGLGRSQPGSLLVFKARTGMRKGRRGGSGSL